VVTFENMVHGLYAVGKFSLKETFSDHWDHYLIGDYVCLNPAYISWILLKICIQSEGDKQCSLVTLRYSGLSVSQYSI
jgi:hypothetical protein